MTVTGDVVLTASDGLRPTTDEATYSSGEQMVRVPRKIEFARGATQRLRRRHDLRPGARGHVAARPGA